MNRLFLTGGGCIYANVPIDEYGDLPTLIEYNKRVFVYDPVDSHYYEGNTPIMILEKDLVA